MASSCPEELGPEPEPESEPAPWEFVLRKYILMLATLVATVTYGVGFNPPGGVWQEDDVDHLAGEPIARTNNNLRYQVFFKCNAFALASSVLVIVLFLLLSINLVEKQEKWFKIKPLRVLMVLVLLSFMGAYAAGSCHDMLTTAYTLVLMAAGVFTYLIVQVVLAWSRNSPHPADCDKNKVQLEERFRKVLMLLAAFALSITYESGLNSPGGFWDNTEGGHRAGESILNDGHHKARLATFFICNSTAFMASLLIIMLLLSGKLHRQTARSREMYWCILVALLGLVGAYAAGSCREAGATSYVLLVVATSLVCILVKSSLWQQAQDNYSQRVSTDSGEEGQQSHKSLSLLLLMSTFATSITYQAGLDPPGGVWQENGNGHLAGDPILLTINASRYRTFMYCNSFAFVLSLVTIVMFLTNSKFVRGLGAHKVEVVMILELFGLIGAYTAGVSKNISTSTYVLALGGAVMFYIVIHVIIFTLEKEGINFYVEQKAVEKKRKLLYLLATMSTAMSYHAGLNPPGGFWVQDDDESRSPWSRHHAGNPVLPHNHPRRYSIFFFCSSVSFMLSVSTMILLVSPVLYRPAIRSYALTICTAMGSYVLMGAYAAGSTQYLKSSMFLLTMIALFAVIVATVLVTFLVRDTKQRLTSPTRVNAQEGEKQAKKKQQAKHKHLMLLAILVAGATYLAGLDPPGGVWQSNDGGHDPGGPAMKDNRRQQYLVFFYSNSTSFAASIVTILLLLLQLLKREEQHGWAMHAVIALDLLALLVAYAAGSSRDWQLAVFVAALLIPSLAVIAFLTRKHLKTQLEPQPCPQSDLELTEPVTRLDVSEESPGRRLQVTSLV